MHIFKESEVFILGIQEVIENPDAEFRRKMFFRLKADCDYFLGNGNRFEGHLWTGEKNSHVKMMKELLATFPVAKQEEILSWEDMARYEKAMLEPEDEVDVQAVPYNDGIAKGLHITVGIETVANVEVMADGEIRIVAYKEGKDEPVEIISYNRDYGRRIYG